MNEEDLTNPSWVGQASGLDPSKPNPTEFALKLWSWPT